MNKMKTIRQLLNMHNWQELQDAMSKVTGMALIMVDYRGNPVTNHSGCSEFCSQVRKDPKLSEYCYRCDARGGLESFRNNKPYIYRCHFSIIDIAIPIVANGNYLGAIMAGQIRLSDDHLNLELEQICTYTSQNRIDEKLWEYYNQIPMLTSEQCLNIVKMLEGVSKHLVVDVKRDDTSMDGERMDSDESFYSKQNEIFENEGKKEMSFHPIIRKSLTVMNFNQGHFYSMVEMARHCNVSPAYFSRLFVKEIGESYTLYVSRQKVSLARGFLEDTDMTVTEISDKLGFSDPGYFIKKYKDSVGVTPAFYRTHYRNENSIRQ